MHDSSVKVLHQGSGGEWCLRLGIRSGRKGQWQALLVQCFGAVQTKPQPPQFAASTLMFTHLPAHQVNPCEQVQDPLWQLDPPVQSTPQVPQLPWLEDRSTQLPLQSTVGGAQEHVPVTHDLPAGQLPPQEPQFLESLPVSTHVPPQLDLGGVQDISH